MLNLSPKTMITFTLGALVGAITAILAVKDMYEKKADEEIAAMEDHYNKKYNMPKGKYEDARKKEEKYEDALESLGYKGENKEDHKVLRMPKTARNYSNYPMDADEEKDLAEKEHPEEDEIDSSAEDDFNPKLPYIISIEEFSEEEDNFDKITIYYYENDNTLVDDKEEIIPDVESTVGEENLDCFDVGGEAISTIYVRNEKMETDFEIICLEKSYSEDVMGFNKDKEHGNKHRPSLRRRDYNDEK